MDRLYEVEVAAGLSYECLADEGLKLKKSSEVIIACERYKDYGRIVSYCDDKPAGEKELAKLRKRKSRGRHVEGRKIPRIIRRANLIDKGKAHENETRCKSMYKTARKKISEHELPMKLINVHFSFDHRLAVFQFSAEGRVDFRKLLRDLSKALHTRVELRQVGVRDEAAIHGGIGPCGRVFCCKSFMKNFVSINVKMAKKQGLSLNPSNISGCCGRLKCCLRYELDHYKKEMAKENQNEDVPSS